MDSDLYYQWFNGLVQSHYEMMIRALQVSPDLANSLVIQSPEMNQGEPMTALQYLASRTDIAFDKNIFFLLVKYGALDKAFLDSHFFWKLIGKIQNSAMNGQFSLEDLKFLEKECPSIVGRIELMDLKKALLQKAIWSFIESNDKDALMLLTREYEYDPTLNSGLEEALRRNLLDFDFLEQNSSIPVHEFKAKQDWIAAVKESNLDKMRFLLEKYPKASKWIIPGYHSNTTAMSYVLAHEWNPATFEFLIQQKTYPSDRYELLYDGRSLDSIIIEKIDSEEVNLHFLKENGFEFNKVDISNKNSEISRQLSSLLLRKPELYDDLYKIGAGCEKPIELSSSQALYLFDNEKKLRVLKIKAFLESQSKNGMITEKAKHEALEWFRSHLDDAMPAVRNTFTLPEQKILTDQDLHELKSISGISVGLVDEFFALCKEQAIINASSFDQTQFFLSSVEDHRYVFRTFPSALSKIQSDQDLMMKPSTELPLGTMEAFTNDPDYQFYFEDKHGVFLKSPAVALILDYYSEKLGSDIFRNVFVIDNANIFEMYLEKLDNLDEGERIALLYQPTDHDNPQYHFNYVLLEKRNGQNYIVVVDSLGADGNYFMKGKDNYKSIYASIQATLSEEAKKKTIVCCNSDKRQNDPCSCAIFSIKDAKNVAKSNDFIKEIEEYECKVDFKNGLKIMTYGLPPRFMGLTQSKTSVQIYEAKYPAKQILKENASLTPMQYAFKERKKGGGLPDTPLVTRKSEWDPQMVVINNSADYFKQKYLLHIKNVSAEPKTEIQKKIDRYDGAKHLSLDQKASISRSNKR